MYQLESQPFLLREIESEDEWHEKKQSKWKEPGTQYWLPPITVQQSGENLLSFQASLVIRSPATLFIVVSVQAHLIASAIFSVEISSQADPKIFRLLSTNQRP